MAETSESAPSAPHRWRSALVRAIGRGVCLALGSIVFTFIVSAVLAWAGQAGHLRLRTDSIGLARQLDQWSYKKYGSEGFDAVVSLPYTLPIGNQFFRFLDDFRAEVRAAGEWRREEPLVAFPWSRVAYRPTVADYRADDERVEMMTGWPARAFRGFYNKSGASKNEFYFGSALPIGLADANEVAGGASIAVPFLPVLRGLWINSALAANALALFILVARSIRTLFRKLRGRCAACAYIVQRESKVCPECGGDRAKLYIGIRAAFATVVVSLVVLSLLVIVVRPFIPPFEPEYLPLIGAEEALRVAEEYVQESDRCMEYVVVSNEPDAYGFGRRIVVESARSTVVLFVGNDCAVLIDTSTLPSM